VGERLKTARARFLQVQSWLEHRNTDGLLERLELPVSLEVRSQGAFSLRGRLETPEGRPLLAASSEVLDLEPGDHTLSLSFDASLLQQLREQGPYMVRDLAVLDHSLSPTELERPDVSPQSPAVALEEMVPPRLEVGRDLYVGEDEPIRLTVRETGRTEPPRVTVRSSAEETPREVTLQELETGVYEAELWVSDGEEATPTPSATREEPDPAPLLVEPSGVVKITFEDLEGHRFVRLLGWLPREPDPRTLEVEVRPRRAGLVTGDGIACPQDCVQTVLHGSRVVLEAAPAAGYELEGWEGSACEGAGPCSFLLREDVNVIARFAEVASDPATPTEVPAPPTRTPVPSHTSTPQDEETPSEPMTPTLPPGSPQTSPETSPLSDDEGTGCSCRSSSSSSPEAAWLGLLVLLEIRRRRRRVQA
jgi:MYXO-CTERM domain-containing protein